MDQTTSHDHLALRTVRLKRKKFTSQHFDNYNSAGSRISFDPGAGTLWFEMWEDESPWAPPTKYLIHARDEPAIEWADGVKAWVQNGLYHRKDGPALEYNGLEDKEDKYYINGVEITKEEFEDAGRYRIEPVDEGTKLSWVMESTSIPHRERDLPAIEWENGLLEWYRKGQPHRDPAKGPAKIWSDGSYAYYYFGQIHRVGGPATEGMDGSQGWFHKGNRHRWAKEGPAITHSDGGVEYWENDVRTNPYGPAVIYPDGSVEYWLEGKKISYEKWKEQYDGAITRLRRQTMAQLKKSLESYVGQPALDNNEDIRQLVEKTLQELVSKAEAFKKFELDKEKELSQIEKEVEQLELALDPTNEKAESSSVSSESDDEKEEGPGWKLTVASLLVAAGVKGFSSLNSSEAVQETVDIEQEYACQ